MALISCRECEASIPEDSNACPECGFPISKPDYQNVKKIREWKATCQSCSHVWHFGMEDFKKDQQSDQKEALKGALCLTGCFPALLVLPTQEKLHLDSQCPMCRSKAIKKEEVVHEVPIG